MNDIRVFHLAFQVHFPGRFVDIVSRLVHFLSRSLTCGPSYQITGALRNYASIFVSLNKKEGISLTLLNTLLNAFILALFDIKGDPDKVVIDFIEPKISNHSEIKAITNLVDKYEASGKDIRLKH